MLFDPIEEIVVRLRSEPPRFRVAPSQNVPMLGRNAASSAHDDPPLRFAYPQQYRSGVLSVLPDPVEPVLDLLLGVDEFRPGPALLREQREGGALDADKDDCSSAACITTGGLEAAFLPYPDKVMQDADCGLRGIALLRTRVNKRRGYLVCLAHRGKSWVPARQSGARCQR